MGKAKRNPTPESVTPLLAPIQALQNLLERFDERGVIIGGVAVSLICGKQFPGCSNPHYIVIWRYQTRFALFC